MISRTFHLCVLHPPAPQIHNSWVITTEASDRSQLRHSANAYTVLLETLEGLENKDGLRGCHWDRRSL